MRDFIAKGAFRDPNVHIMNTPLKQTLLPRLYENQTLVPSIIWLPLEAKVVIVIQNNLNMIHQERS